MELSVKESLHAEIQHQLDILVTQKGVTPDSESRYLP